MFNPEAIYSVLLKHIRHIYLLYAIPMVVIAAAVTPPFQVPDEPNHFFRAEQVTRFELAPQFYRVKDSVNAAGDPVSKVTGIYGPDNGGFAVDAGLAKAAACFTPVEQRAKAKVSPAMYTSSKTIKWGTGIVHKNFANTAIYAPVVYIVPVIGIVIGKLLSLPVVNTLYLSRLLTGAVCIAMCFLALTLARQSNILLFTIMLFPMGISLFGSVSQDALLICSSFLLVAIIDNVEFDPIKTYKTGRVLLLVFLASMIAVAKPPYIVFIVIFLFLKLSKKQKIAAMFIPVIATASWLVINHANFSIKFASALLRINSKMQLAGVIHHPLNFIGLFFKWDGQAIFKIFRMFVGILGWLDLEFSGTYYWVAAAILLCAILCKLSFNKNNHVRLRVGLLLVTFLTLISVLTAQYITWTHVGATELGGMQGRYTIPIVPFLALALSNNKAHLNLPRMRTLLLILVIAFPLYSCITMFEGLMHRYY